MSLIDKDIEDAHARIESGNAKGNIQTVIDHFRSINTNDDLEKQAYNRLVSALAKVQCGIDTGSARAICLKKLYLMWERSKQK